MAACVLAFHSGFFSASDMVFRVALNNHRCFLYQGRPMKTLTSAEHYGAVMNTEFDYDVYLKEMLRTRQNQTRVLTFYPELHGYHRGKTLACSDEKPLAIVSWAP